MMQSDIGCCPDYTLMLTSFLKHLTFDVDAVMNAGHQAVKVEIDGRSHMLDSNNLIYAQGYFGGGRQSIRYFTPYNGTRTVKSQRYVLKSLASGLEGFERPSWKILTTQEHYKLFKADFLADASLH